MDPNGFTRRGFRRRNRPNRSVVKERTDYRIPYQTLLVKIWVNYSQPSLALPQPRADNRPSPLRHRCPAAGHPAALPGLAPNLSPSQGLRLEATTSLFPRPSSTPSGYRLPNGLGISRARLLVRRPHARVRLRLPAATSSDSEFRFRQLWQIPVARKGVAPG